ncbi:uncharacterized protein LOC134268376 [Saccostrea cucullata]|uniref:uncharacterized protein LOC134268376 n=1 Tax=Saccostrea cuccullata TaxID=36930 RepID=UPI002ED025EB
MFVCRHLRILYTFNVLLIICCVESAFKQDVTPSCPESAEECTFNFRVNYIMTMVSYNWTIDEGNPVFLRNGTFMKKTSDAEHGVAHFCEELPVTSEEMEEVVTTDGNYRFMFAINNQFPGPTISVYENQRVKIHVYNDLANEGVTFHWHGMSQNGSVYMDGVSMVTQCPILPGQMFTYL